MSIKIPNQSKETGSKSKIDCDKTSVGCMILSTLIDFVPKLILEVFGGAGAIWGFSETCGLRRPETVWFWRPAALSVGFIFFLRFLFQLRQRVVVSSQQMVQPKPKEQQHVETSKPPDTMPHYDLELGESDSNIELKLSRSTSTDSNSTSSHASKSKGSTRSRSSLR